MEALQAVGNWIWTAQPNWELILRFIEVLVWPVITLLGLLMARPWVKIIAERLMDGGELGIGPASLKFANRVREISEAVEEDEPGDAAIEPPAESPLQESGDPYTIVMNGWGRVAQGIEAALDRAGLGPLDRRNPMEAIARLRRAKMIGARLSDNVQAVWDFRNRVVKAGSRALERLGLNQVSAEDYYATADRVRRSLGRAIDYRDAKGMLTPAQPSPGQTMN